MSRTPTVDPEAQALRYRYSNLFTEPLLVAATLLGGPVTGLVLLRSNFLETGEPEKARQTLIVGIGATVAWYALLFWLIYHVLGFSLIGLLKVLPPAVFFALVATFQRMKLREFLSGGAWRHPAAATLKAMALGLAVEAGATLLSLALLPIMPGPHVDIGQARHRLHYAGMDEREAAMLADDLEAVEHFTGSERRFAKAIRKGTTVRILFPVDRGDWSDLEHRSYYALLLRDLEKRENPDLEGCFISDGHTPWDSVCFRKDAVKELNPLLTPGGTGREAVLAHVRAEIDFYRALFHEAIVREKNYLTWNRIPSLLIIATNAVATVDRDAIPDAVVEAYGSKENARLGLNILAYGFQGVKWNEGGKLFPKVRDILDRMRGNIGPIEEYWKTHPPVADPAPGGADS